MDAVGSRAEAIGGITERRAGIADAVEYKKQTNDKFTFSATCNDGTSTSLGKK